MAVRVELKDITPKPFRLTGDRSFDVRVDGSPLCFLISTREDRILAWDGRVDFPTLEDEVFEKLRLSIPLIISGGYAIREAAKVSILTEQADLMKFCLKSADDDFSLQRWLSNPNASGAIRFIRVDVGTPKDLLDYSFSTENNPNSSENELALRIPRRMPINGTLIDWVIRHHQKPPRLEIEDTYQIAFALNKAC